MNVPRFNISFTNYKYEILDIKYAITNLRCEITNLRYKLPILDYYFCVKWRVEKRAEEDDYVAPNFDM